MKKEILIFAVLLILTGCSATTSSSDIVDTVIATETNGTSAASASREDSQPLNKATYGDRSGLTRDLQKAWWKQHDARKEELQLSYDNGEISEIDYLNELLALEEEYYGWCSDEYNAVYARIEELNNQ